MWHEQGETTKDSNPIRKTSEEEEDKRLDYF